MNENMQISKESTPKKVNSIKEHHPTRVDAHIDIVYICLIEKVSYYHAQQY